MEKKTLGNYQIMIASKYFERIDDFINLEIAVKRFNGNMERFHFNPIPLNDFSRKLFANVETLNLYCKDDLIFNDGKIFKYCIWYRLDYRTYLEEKEKGNDCKCVCYTCFESEHGKEIPNGIKVLRPNCFIDRLDLKTVSIPSSVTKMDHYCYGFCTRIESITILSTVNKIGHECFTGCESLKSIETNSEYFVYDFKIFLVGFYLRSFVKWPKVQVTKGINTIKPENNSITLPSSVNEICGYCFDNCYSLKSITLPNSVTKMGEYCFLRCSSLTSIQIPNSVCKLGRNCFSYCSSLKLIDLPTSINQINCGCFSDCTSLKSITIPSSITKLDEGCFSNCSSLTSITINAEYFIFEKGIYLKSKCFRRCVIPGTVSIINGHPFFNGTNVLVTIPLCAVEIDSECFSSCKTLTSIDLPSSITKIGNKSFKDCTSLKSIKIPNSVVEIGIDCFCGCSSLETIELPSSVTKIGNWCFRNCTALKGCEIPNTVVDVGLNCFLGCSKKEKKEDEDDFENFMDLF